MAVSSCFFLPLLLFPMNPTDRRTWNWWFIGSEVSCFRIRYQAFAYRSLLPASLELYVKSTCDRVLQLALSSSSWCQAMAPRLHAQLPLWIQISLHCQPFQGAYACLAVINFSWWLIE
jgi:hypothetical protein